MTEYHSSAPVAESLEAEEGEDDVEEEEDAERHNHQDPGETLLKWCNLKENRNKKIRKFESEIRKLKSESEIRKLESESEIRKLERGSEIRKGRWKGWQVEKEIRK